MRHEIRWVRGFIKRAAYLRALKRPHKRCAKIVIEQYRAQEVVERKLRGYQLENRTDWTPAEWKFRQLLRELGLSSRREVGLSCKNGKHYFLDFLIRRPRIAFEIDGSVHKNRDTYDTERDIAIRHSFSENIPFRLCWPGSALSRCPGLCIIATINSCRKK